MKYILFSICFSVFYLTQAQKQNTLVLKNGNSYKGVIISKDSNRITLLGRDLNTYVFDTAEIAVYAAFKKDRLPPVRMKSGYMHDIAVALHSGLYRNNVQPAGLNFHYTFDYIFDYRHAIGLESIVYINFDFVPSIGLKYRYDFMPKASTPFFLIRAGNYADPFWSAGVGSRYSAGIGYQWGHAEYKRSYFIIDFGLTNGRYYGRDNQKFTETIKVLTIGFGLRI